MKCIYCENLADDGLTCLICRDVRTALSEFGIDVTGVCHLTYGCFLPKGHTQQCGQQPEHSVKKSFYAEMLTQL